jgi:hypothetical protein
VISLLLQQLLRTVRGGSFARDAPQQKGFVLKFLQRLRQALF